MFTLPQLPYAYDALEPFIDKETMLIHHDKHHLAYLDNFNKILETNEQLSKLSAEKILVNLTNVPSDIRNKVRNFGGGYVNHSLFWEIMTPPNNYEPQGKLVSSINQIFGSLGKLEEIFTTTAMARFGSGWSWLVVDPLAKAGQQLVIMDTPNQDTPLSIGKIPILTLDVWEHAYYLKYQNRRLDYVKAWWNVVNWKEVENKFEKATTQI